MSSAPSTSTHSHQYAGSDDMSAVQAMQHPQQGTRQEQSQGDKGQSDAQWATEVYRNAGSHQQVQARTAVGTPRGDGYGRQSQVEELRQAAPISSTPRTHHSPYEPQQTRPAQNGPNASSRVSSSSSLHDAHTTSRPITSPGGSHNTPIPLPLPPDQQTISDTTSIRTSMSVRVPSRIPSSAERKSSLPPPISPRSASLSAQQMAQGTPRTEQEQGRYGHGYGQNAQGGPSTLRGANASSSTLRGVNAKASGSGSGSQSGAGSSSNSDPHGNGGAVNTLTAATARQTRSPRTTQSLSSQSSQNRIPSRHLLQSALDLAQQAVQMDQNNDVSGALAAYREAVGRLQAVMDRVAADEERGGRRRRGPKSEEEGRTLQGIHDAYVARIQLLSSYDTADPPLDRFPIPPNTGASSSSGIEGIRAGGANDTAGASTATLVPARSPHIPQQATDDRIAGNSSHHALDLGAPVAGSSMPGAAHTAPLRVDTSAEPVPSSADTNSAGHDAAIGVERPSSPAKRARNGRPETAGSGASTHSRQMRLRNQSMGLEDEAGLTEADGLVDVDPNAEQETLASPVVPNTSTAGKVKGHHSRTSSLGGRIGQLISSSTSHGTISQRRNKVTSPRISIESQGDSIKGGLQSAKSLDVANSDLQGDHRPDRSGQTPVRSRSVSQPGSRRGEVYQGEMGDNVPPLPDMRKKTSISNMTQSFRGLGAGSVRSGSDSLAPPQQQVAHRSPSHSSLMRSDAGSMTSRSARSRSHNGSLISPVPPAQPTEVLHRPFHVLRILRSSMDADGPGAYLTGAIHIPSAVWNPSAYTKEGTRLPGPRITAQDVKIRIIDQLLLHLEIIRHTGALLLEGPREVNFAVAGVAAPRVGLKKCIDTGDEFARVLEAFEEEMDGVYKSLIKGGVVLDAWKGKKGSNAMSWSSKMARSMDKMGGSSKGLESPDRYVDILAALCSNLQTIDEHLYNFTGPCTPAYHALSESTYRQLEARMLRAADFVKIVVAPFVLDDFKQFFHRYLRAGMLYIEN